jgi:hypothetical protein
MRAVPRQNNSQRFDDYAERADLFLSRGLLPGSGLVMEFKRIIALVPTPPGLSRLSNSSRGDQRHLAAGDTLDEHALSIT